MTAKKTTETEVEIETPEDVATDIGFTPEEEAALDAAAKSEPVKGAEAKKPDAKPAAKVAEEAPKPEDEIVALKKKLEAETARANEAEVKRKEAETKKVASVDDIEADEKNRIKISDERVAADLALAERDVADLRRQLREAKNDGELDKEDEINDKLLDAKIKHKQLLDAKAGYETWKENRPAFWDKERKKVERASQAPDQDAYNPDDFSEKARKWIDETPQFKTDKKFRSRAIAAHYEAEADDIKVDTPEYFEFLNKRLGLGTEVTEEEQAVEDEATADTATEVETKKPEAKKPTTKVATLPPTRSGGTQRQSSDGRIKKLTAAEREAAEISGMSPEEYWNEKYGNQN